MSAGVAAVPTGDRYHPNALPRPTDAFRGRRVRDGLIWRFIPDDGPSIKASIEDAEMTAETPARRVEQPGQPPRPLVVGPVICECGCLLRDENELCPACVIPWCRAQEERGKRLQTERANRAGWWTKHDQKGAA